MAETRVKLGMQCRDCGSWNWLEARKIFEQSTQEQKVNSPADSIVSKR